MSRLTEQKEPLDAGVEILLQYLQLLVSATTATTAKAFAEQVVHQAGCVSRRLRAAEERERRLREALKAMRVCYVTAREAQGWPRVTQLPVVRMADAALAETEPRAGEGEQG